MISRLIRISLLLLCTATACVAQINLDLALPATGTAGSTIDNLIGSGFPTGQITPANVGVSISAWCNGNTIAWVTPTAISADFYTFRSVTFALPLSLAAGKYALSLKGTMNGGQEFKSDTCAWITVTPQTAFVKVTNGQLTLAGQPFHFSGGNEAGLSSTPGPDTTKLLETAQYYQLQVLRIWTFIDIGSLNGSGSVDGPENGFYFQYWNGTAPAFNDGLTGLRNLDLEIYQAEQKGFKLDLTLTNNWTPSGGMDQYVAWAGDQYHDQFYTDPRIIAWYEAWVSHLLNHVNPFTGVAYKNDPAIMTWELANEPRCQGTGDYPTSSSCTTTTLTNWITQVSAFVKTIDQNHLLAVGDEGPFCVPGSNNPNAYDGCSSGDDAVAFASVPDIDLVGMHLYTQALGTDPTYGTEYIQQHIDLGKSLGKPTYLGEYGLTSGNQRNLVYDNWEQTILHGGAAGAIVWSISGGQPGPLAAEAGNNLGLAYQAPLLNTIGNFAQESAAGQDLYFDPVADDQWAVTTLNTAITLNPLQNVLTYGGTTINPSSITLHPEGGPETTVHPYGGVFAVSNGLVNFTPDSSFNGQAVASFAVKDSLGNISNTAFLDVTVNPTDSVPYEIESFETGTDGWSGNGDAVSQSTIDATNGPHSLKVVATKTGWFGIFFSSPISLANRPNLTLDITNTGASASSDLVIQTGNNYQWCQSNLWPWLTTGTRNTISMALTPAGTGCADPGLSQIDAIYVYLVAGNTYYLDNLQAGAVPVAQQPIVISSFENGTDGWGPQSPGGGTVEQENTFYTDGAFGLTVTANGGGAWIGSNLPSLDLSSKSGISYDIDTPNNGSSVNMQLYFGPNNTYCQGTNWGWADSSLSTQTIPFNTLSCSGGVTPDLTQVTGLWLYFSPGTYYIDYVRAQ